MVDTAMHARMLNSLVALVLLLGATGAARASCDGAEQGLAAAQEELGQGRVDSALARLAALARSHPKCGETPLLQAQVHAALGNARQAEGFFSEAITLAPGQPAPIFQLGVFYDGRQQHGRAAEQFRRVLALAPADPQAYDYLGLSLEALGDFAQAESAYRMGLARNSGPRFDPMLHYNYGRFLAKHGKLADAKSHLDEAVKLSPAVRAVHYERAKLSERLGDLAGARSHAERALQLPDRAGVILDMQVHYLLARIYRTMGETALAKEYAALSAKGEIPLAARQRSGR